MVEQRVDQDGDGQAGQDIDGVLALAAFGPAFGHDADQGDGAAVHHRRAEAADEPEQEVMVLKGIEEIDVLKKGEAGADGETDDGRVDQKAQPVAAQQQEEIDGLGRSPRRSGPGSGHKTERPARSWPGASGSAAGRSKP